MESGILGGIGGGRYSIRRTLVPRLDKRLIHVAPAPVLAGLEGLDDGMMGLAGVPARVLVRGGVAASDFAAREAKPQVNPGASDAKALLAPIRGPGLDALDQVHMGAADGCLGHGRILPESSTEFPGRSRKFYQKGNVTWPGAGPSNRAGILRP